MGLLVCIAMGGGAKISLVKLNALQHKREGILLQLYLNSALQPTLNQTILSVRGNSDLHLTVFLKHDSQMKAPRTYRLRIISGPKMFEIG